MMSWLFTNRFRATGKFFSEALILESVNPQYDDRLFKKIASSENVKNMF